MGNSRFKFRVWLKYSEKMIYIDKKEGDNLYSFLENVNDRQIIMQCTGLKDKNGKLIYEGDILQSEEYPFKDEKGYNYAAEVLWDDASATFYYYTFRISNNVVGCSTGNTGELNEYEDWKVIGNIYENKELLEVK